VIPKENELLVMTATFIYILFRLNSNTDHSIQLKTPSELLLEQAILANIWATDLIKSTLTCLEMGDSNGLKLRKVLTFMKLEIMVEL
jgi:hypothetical protein